MRREEKEECGREQPYAASVPKRIYQHRPTPALEDFTPVEVSVIVAHWVSPVCGASAVAVKVKPLAIPPAAAATATL